MVRRPPRGSSGLFSHWAPAAYVSSDSAEHFRLSPIDSASGVPGARAIGSPSCAQPRHAHQDRAANIPDSVHPRSGLTTAGAVWLQSKFGIRFPSGFEKNFATILRVRQFHWLETGVPGGRSFGKELGMHECVYCRPHGGDSGLVASEIPIGGRKGCLRFTKWKFILLLLGGGLLIGACANDSTEDNTPHRHHRRGNGHGRDQTESIDRSDNPSPTPALGW
jgi:hypothetical protein